MLPNWYSEYVQSIEQALKKYSEWYFHTQGTKVVEDFKEIFFYGNNGGKRLRAILALEFYLQFSGKTFKNLTEDDDIWKICIAIEILHAFSLIHDDLPCMDNDELRRGQLTVWKKYGEHQAVLVGDMMNTLCFEILSEIQDAEISKRIIKTIAHAVGIYGMVGGQIEDMYYETHKEELTKEILIWLHNKKTWALIQASILSGIILWGGNQNDEEKFKKFWLDIGLAFQIKDDLLDVEWTAEETGKSVWWEQKWFVFLCGKEATKKELHTLIENSLITISEFNSEKFQFIVDYIANRTK